MTIYPQTVNQYVQGTPLSDEKKTLLLRMMQVDPKTRWTIGEAAQYFRAQIKQKV